MVSFLLVRTRPGFRWAAMAACGLVIGFLLPAVARFTTRIHQGYNLYNVGFAAGILGLGIASVLKGFGVEFAAGASAAPAMTGSTFLGCLPKAPKPVIARIQHTRGPLEFAAGSGWSKEGHGLLCALVSMLLLGLLGTGIAMGCRSWQGYKHILHHSGRAVADFVVLDGPGPTLVNMALVGSVGFAYLLALYPLGVRLNGPLVCCILAMTGFGAFGKHPRVHASFHVSNPPPAPATWT